MGLQDPPRLPRAAASVPLLSRLWRGAGGRSGSSWLGVCRRTAGSQCVSFTRRCHNPFDCVFESLESIHLRISKLEKLS